MKIRALALLAALSLPALSLASEVAVVGMFPGRALVTIDGAAPRIMAPGSQIGDVKLLSVTADSATFVVSGQQVTIRLGQYRGGSAASGRSSTTLTQSDNGHFMTTAIINGNGSVRMMVDTGASMIAISGAEAQRLGINYHAGAQGMVTTANGVVPVFHVVLDSVKVGDVVLNQVDALVQEQLTGTALLGMSFLNRTEMTRSGESMVLTKRY